MLNEPVQEAGQAGSGGGAGGVSGGVAEAGGMNYIQVTPQEKEAIERVKLFSFKNTILSFKSTFFYFCTYLIGI